MLFRLCWSLMNKSDKHNIYTMSCTTYSSVFDESILEGGEYTYDVRIHILYRHATRSPFQLISLCSSFANKV